MMSPIIVFNEPIALELRVACFATSPLLNNNSINGLNMPNETNEKKVASKVHTRYTINLPLNCDMYVKIRENFFI
jgi:hypothetical protein